jgi:hypothetical protein
MSYIVASARPIIVSNRHPPRRTKIRAKDVELAIQQATNLCFNFEDTPACRVAWDRVEELSSEYARQRDAPLETREYDV